MNRIQETLMSRIFTAFFILALATPAMASTVTRTEYTSLLAVPSTSAASARTVVADTRLVSKLCIVVALVHDSASAVTITVHRRAKHGGFRGQMHTLNVATGAIVLSAATYTRAVSGDTYLSIEMPTSAWAEITIVVAATGGGAKDKLSVDVAGAVDGN